MNLQHTFWPIAMACCLAPSANAELALAQAKNCMSCHTVEKKVVGPAFKDVSIKYANRKDAATQLSQKIVKGGGGVWGPVPMPANAQVSETEARRLSQWILGLR